MGISLGCKRPESRGDSTSFVGSRIRSDNDEDLYLTGWRDDTLDRGFLRKLSGHTGAIV